MFLTCVLLNVWQLWAIFFFFSSSSSLNITENIFTLAFQNNSWEYKEKEVKNHNLTMCVFNVWMCVILVRIF